MRKILIAISFFTRFPIKLKDVSEEEFYDSMIFMPLVGLLVGAILFAVSWALSYIHVIQLQALFTMIVYIWITGGLHLDGFADTVDALFSARDHAKMMEIMKDSRLGSFGAIGLILLGWGIVQVGLSLQSHDPSQRSNGFLTLAGGIVITFSKEILTLITG